MNGACTYHDVVVTAANESQAAAYRAELDERKRLGRLAAGTAFHVMADPGGRRVGSGAATLVVIERLAKLYRTTPAKLATKRRVLILHSGGDSRRLPAYAASGKLFVPLPRTDERGRDVSLFDLLLADLSTPELGRPGRVVVAAGDVYVSLASRRLALDGADVVGVALRRNAAAGTRHGVYVAGPSGHVADFLQKPSIDEAKRAGAVDADGKVLLDSGVVALSARAVGELTHAARMGGRASLLANVLRGELGQFDFYEHVLIAAYTAQSPRSYADGLAQAGSKLHAGLQAFKELLRRSRRAWPWRSRAASHTSAPRVSCSTALARSSGNSRASTSASCSTRR
ncbi:MAG: L-fucokinase [Phycisphaerales bacterium]